MTHRGELRAIGLMSPGNRRHRIRWKGFLVGRVRCAMCVNSCTVSTSAQSPTWPMSSVGSGGVGQSTMVGASRNGSDAPFDTLYGSSITTDTLRAGPLPTSATTASCIPSSLPAASIAHGRMTRGKWTSKWVVWIVSQCSSGRVYTCALIGEAARPKEAHRHHTAPRRSRMQEGNGRFPVDGEALIVHYAPWRHRLP